MPDHPPPEALHHRWFVEIFAGKARLTRSMRRRGFHCLPAIDLLPCADFPDGCNLFDDHVLIKVLNWARSGLLKIVHFGTPCTTYSIARTDITLRSKKWIHGVPGLPAAERSRVQDGTRCAMITSMIARVVWDHGGHWTIENPASSLLWDEKVIRQLWDHCGAFPIYLDQCAFGSSFMKPTIFLASDPSMIDLSRTCPGESSNHHHDRLRGKCKDPARPAGPRIWKTKLAQIYPDKLCDRYSSVAAHEDLHFLLHAPADLPPHCPSGIRQFHTAFDVGDHGSRKRPLGDPILRVGRPRRSDLMAASAGYQQKRSVQALLIPTEMTPGDTIKHVLDQPHPFHRHPDLHPQLQCSIDRMRRDPGALNRHRLDRATFWTQRALDLRDASITEILSHQDPYIRRLLFLNIDKPAADRRLGEFVHLALWREIAASADVGDRAYINAFRDGLPIVGPIAQSGVWQPILEESKMTIDQLLSQAWVIRSRISHSVIRHGAREHCDHVWNATIKEAEQGFMSGPFYDHSQVTNFVGSDDWICTERFGILQKGKIRNIDSATASSINPATQMTELLEIATTDGNVAIIRKLRTSFPGSIFSSWILDEKDAYRWIPVRPDHRKFAVIATYDPNKGTVAYFVMIGHPFGMRSAVYNYNRRSMMLNTILRKEFDLISSFYYDDKFCFEIEDTITTSLFCAILIHQILGVIFNMTKLQLGDHLPILGIQYDLNEFRLTVTSDRKKDLINEVFEVMRTRSIGSGQAGKLRGKLGFAASMFWGKIGRAFFRSLSERQYDQKGSTDLSPAILASLAQWIKILVKGTPRPIEITDNMPADITIFTDGFYPNPILGESGTPGVGGVIFDRSRSAPITFFNEISDDLMSSWLPRATQISMIEMFAPILVLAGLGNEIEGRSSVILIDNEAVESALIKGYSRKDDLCALTGIFWDLCERLKIEAYVDRVSTDANIADGPSRNDPKFWEMADRLGWKRVYFKIPPILDLASSQGLGATT